MDDLLHVSALEIAKRIREGRLTSRQAVEAHIAQVERVNPAINALVQDRFAEARREADVADEKLGTVATDELPPLHGVPCTIKECLSLTGMPNTSGLVRRKGIVSSEDATTVRRLREAGAIPLGVTNTSELCMWMESNNYVYGRTNNPYDHGRIAGGSSGGEGAIVAAGASPFGLGSDIGGSIRGPAFFNGVFGHKATGTLVPGTGQYPIAENDALRFLTTGPLARRAEDLMPLLRILAGPDGQDSRCVEWELGEPSDVNLEGRTLLVVEGNGRVAVNQEMRQAQQRAASALESKGMVVRSTHFDALKKQADIWSSMLARAQETPFTKHMGGDKHARPLLEIIKWAFRRSDYTLMTSVLGLVDEIPKRFARYSDKMAELGQELKQEMCDALGDDGVMLYPPYPTPAPAHNAPLAGVFSLKMPWAYQGIFNVLEFPATQVPLGLDSRGLPLGVQVISKHGNDHVTIAVAMELERALGGWVPPKLVPAAQN